jgi:hypothetical protein
VTQFIEYSDFSILIQHLSGLVGFNFKEYLFEKKLPLERVKIEDWSDLQTVILSQDFFSETSSDYLIDISNLKIDEKSCQQIVQYSEQNLFFYSSAFDRKFSADEKKFLKKFKIETLTLKKIDKSIANQLLLEYLDIIKLGLTISEQNKLVENLNSYNQIVDYLDYIDLVEDNKTAFQNLIQEPSLPIFMMRFTAGKSVKEAKTWFNLVNDDEIQLHLSLIYTKLEKQNNLESKKLLKELILTDQKIKTVSKIKPSLWLKLFLWRAYNGF